MHQKRVHRANLGENREMLESLEMQAIKAGFIIVGVAGLWWGRSGVWATRGVVLDGVYGAMRRKNGESGMNPFTFFGMCVG